MKFSQKKNTFLGNCHFVKNEYVFICSEILFFGFWISDNFKQKNLPPFQTFFLCRSSFRLAVGSRESENFKNESPIIKVHNSVNVHLFIYKVKCLLKKSLKGLRSGWSWEIYRSSECKYIYCKKQRKV